jgi:hypothetical protein
MASNINPGQNIWDNETRKALEVADSEITANQAVDATQTTNITTLLARVAAVQADSVAADVATLVTDFNGLLAKLKAAGLMASS